MALAGIRSCRGGAHPGGGHAEESPLRDGQCVSDDGLTVALLRKPSALDFQFALPLGETFLLLHDATLLLT